MVGGKKLTDSQMEQLAVKESTGVIKGFKSKKGKAFEAKLILVDKKVKFQFN